MLLMLFASVVRCATKSNVSPGATVTVNEYGSAVGSSAFCACELRYAVVAGNKPHVTGAL